MRFLPSTVLGPVDNDMRFLMAGTGEAELKHPAWGIGAKDYLDALINGQHPLAEVYKMRSDGPDGSKADMVRATVLDYRAHARRQLLDEYPSIAAEISAQRMDRLHQVQ